MIYWIIGGGKFGSRAVDCLKKKAGARVVLIDSDPASLAGWQAPVKTVQADGIEFLACELDAGNLPDWIVAAVPVHLAYEWVRRTLAPQCEIIPLPVSGEIARLVPHPFQGSNGELYISHSDTMCPDDCPEPPGRCYATGLARGEDLFQILQKLPVADYSAVVLRSRQLAPGVGAYSPQALFDTRAAVARTRGRVLLSTACSCHGVMHAFEVTEKKIFAPVSPKPNFSSDQF